MGHYEKKLNKTQDTVWLAVETRAVQQLLKGRQGLQQASISAVSQGVLIQYF